MDDAMLRAMFAAHVAPAVMAQLGLHAVEAVATRTFEIADAMVKLHRDRVLAEMPRDQFGRPFR